MLSYKVWPEMNEEMADNHETLIKYRDVTLDKRSHIGTAHLDG
jgi:hypothetical protein